MKSLDKAKVLEWLKETAERDEELSRATSNSYLKAKYEHYEYAARVVVEKIQSGAFDLPTDVDCKHEYVVHPDESVWRCALCGEISPHCPSIGVDVKEIEEALSKATTDPWWNESGIIHAKHPELWRPESCAAEHVCAVRSDREDEDAHLIANAPTWLRQLLTKLAEQQKRYEILNGFFIDLSNRYDEVVGRLQEQLAEREARVNHSWKITLSATSDYAIIERKLAQATEALEPLTKSVVYKALRHYDKQSLYEEDEWFDLDTARRSVGEARQALQSIKGGSADAN